MNLNGHSHSVATNTVINIIIIINNIELSFKVQPGRSMQNFDEYIGNFKVYSMKNKG